jgi:hypothetical protein
MRALTPCRRDFGRVGFVKHRKIGLPSETTRAAKSHGSVAMRCSTMRDARRAGSTPSTYSPARALSSSNVAHAGHWVTHLFKTLSQLDQAAPQPGSHGVERHRRSDRPAPDNSNPRHRRRQRRPPCFPPVRSRQALIRLPSLSHRRKVLRVRSVIGESRCVVKLDRRRLTRFGSCRSTGCEQSSPARPWPTIGPLESCPRVSRSGHRPPASHPRPALCPLEYGDKRQRVSRSSGHREQKTPCAITQRCARDQF